MLFSSLTFVWFFLPALALIYYISPGRKLKNGVLLMASLVFYSWGEPRYVVLVVLSILVIGVWLGLKMWMKLPEIPDLLGGTGTAQGDGAPNFDGAELPEVARSGSPEYTPSFWWGRTPPGAAILTPCCCSPLTARQRRSMA